MSEISSGNEADISQWIIIVLTAVGLVAQHLWSREQITVHRRQDRFDKYIADPSRIIVANIDAFSVTVPFIPLGEAPAMPQKVAHATLVRSINAFVRGCVGSPVSGGDDWYKALSTKSIEQGLPTEAGQIFSALSQKTLLADLDRLRRLIQDEVDRRRS